jgi:23S rRNA pseudouridine2605 synthase
LGFDVLRLIRVAIGPQVLGELAKGQWRQLAADEVRALDTRSKSAA